MVTFISKHKNSLVNLMLWVVILNLFVFSGCSHSANETHQHSENPNEETIVKLTESQFKMAGITVGKVEQRMLSNKLRVNGIIDAPPQNIVSISAPLGGFVVSTKLLQGMKINKGQILAIMEHPDYVQLQQDYLDKKSKLEFLEKEFTRQEELFKENVNSAKIFQQAKSDYFSIKVQVKGLQEKLAILGIDATKLSEENLSRKVKIYSPIKGFVSAVNVNIGKYANPTDVMFEIVNTQHLHAELTVYEKDVGKLKIGQKVHFTLPNDNANERLAYVYLIGRKINADRSVSVHAHLDNEDIELLPGMFITANIDLDENRVNAVPEEAIVMSEGKHYVFVFHEEQTENNEKLYPFEMVEVQKGISEKGFTEITFTDRLISDTSEMVAKGAFSLLAKMKNTEEEGGGHGH